MIDDRQAGYTTTRCEICSHRCMNGTMCNAQVAHYEPPTECARDELVTWAVEHGLEPDDVTWLLGWAARRYAQQLGVMEEALDLVIDAEGPTMGTVGQRLADLAAVGRAARRRLGYRPGSPVNLAPDGAGQGEGGSPRTSPGGVLASPGAKPGEALR